MAEIYLLLKRGQLAKVYGPVEESIVGKAQQNFISRGYGAYRIGKPPAERTLRRWKSLFFQNKLEDAEKKKWVVTMNQVADWKKIERKNRLTAAKQRV